MASRRLTVLQVLPALESGGVERGTLEVANALVHAGHRSMVMSSGGQLVPHLVDRGSEHFEWPIGKKSLWTLRLVRRMRKFLETERVDILHLRSRMPAWIGYLAWRGMNPRTRPRLVTTVHGLYSVNRYSRVMTYGEKIIAVSDAVRRYILDNYPRVDDSRIVTIHRGVDPQIFPYGYRPSAHWYQSFPYLLDKHVLTIVGRLSRLKGHEDFIELIARLRHQGINVHGLIVGGEEPGRAAYAKELREQVAERELEGDITFMGNRSDVREIYAASNIVVSLSHRPESFGRTVMEALSLGVPVVGYEHGGVGEILTNVLPEGCVSVNDLDALTARAMAFLDKPPHVPDSKEYTLQRMLDETLGLYQSLATSRHAS